MIGKFGYCHATSRRSLLKVGAALGATALLPRRSARAQTSFVRPDINSTAGQRMLGFYAQGVGKMKDPSVNIPPQPQSWTFQAYMHGVPADPFQPVESPGLRHGSPGLSARIDLIYGHPAQGTPQADWKAAALKCWATCPHSSPLFVAWHRWYLFYFEKIVRSLSGAPDFALPYWNYASDTAASLQLPAAFQNPATSPTIPTNPLYEDLRGLGFYNPAGTGAQNLPMNEGGYLPYAATDYGPALSGAQLFPSDDGTNFADLPDPRYQALGFTGRLEIQPHDNVHVNVGGLMQNVPVAAYDPIFFVHHCQIDRLWATWQSFQNIVYNWGTMGIPGTDPSESVWKGSKFSFVDEHNKLVEVTAAGQLKTSDMGYAYDALAPLLPQVAALAAAPVAAAPKLVQASGLSVGSGGGRVTLAPMPQSNPMAAPQGVPSQPATLVLKDVKLLARPPAPLHVFLNLPDGAAPDLISPFHVGMLNFFNWDTGSGGPMQDMVGPSGAMPSSGEFRFAVGEVLARQNAQNLWNGGPITVTITTLGADRSRGRTYVTIGQVQLAP
jgi:tyrosinase